MIALRFDPHLVDCILIKYLKVFGWDVVNGPDRGEYSTSTNSLKLLKSSLANMSHMPYFVNPLERYHFMDEDLFQDQKQVLGITEDISIVQSLRPHNEFSVLHSKGTCRARRGYSNRDMAQT